MKKRVLLVIVLALTAYAAILTYINHGQGVLLDRVLRCAASSTYMQA